MTIGTVPICESCAHLRPADSGVGLVCTAYPDGIPDGIYLDGFDHRQAFDGDGGVRWQQADSPDADELLAAYEAAH